MTDHISGKDSYVDCDRYWVADVTPYSDFDEHVRPDKQCYCGADAVQMALVSFTRVEREIDGWSNDEITDGANAHRCDQHSFELK